MSQPLKPAQDKSYWESTFLAQDEMDQAILHVEGVDTNQLVHIQLSVVNEIKIDQLGSSNCAVVRYKVALRSDATKWMQKKIEAHLEARF